MHSDYTVGDSDEELDALTATLTTNAVYLSDDHRLRAQLTPDDPCWVMCERTWTWGSAWHDIQRLAGALVHSGVRRGDRIGFLHHNHPAILMAMHAASLVGAADVVLDPRLMPDELADILADADVRVLFVRHDLVPSIDALGDDAPACVVVGGPADEMDTFIASGTALGQQPGVTPDDPCLVLYSSGTTGRPKGIVLTQHNLLVHTQNAFPEIECRPGHRILLSNVMFHSCALLAAASGASGIVLPDLMPDSLLGALEAGLTHAFLTPAAMGRLESAGLLDRFGRLELVAYGSAPMPPERVRTAMAAMPRTRFVHIYGLTECVAVLTALGDTEHRDPTDVSRRRSCGRPVEGVEVRVVDPASTADVPAGRTGELWFRTEQTMAGYFRNHAATVELIAEGNWVRTGDIGHVDDNGYVYIEDRMKDLVLVNGWSVFPAQVERVLADHPAVLEAAVIGVPDEQLGETVKAIVMTRSEDDVDMHELVGFCRRRLAEHKVPTSIDFVTSLPHNSLGKVLKRELREPYWAASGRRI
jgi:acyl-CoA synthetase (AMP-forming)/AMP-acid ligase II